MNKLNLDEMKAAELDVLCKIHDICVKEDINYSLAYGTLLGAIRHKGFIPWDDDIDLLMPRDDYEKFMKYCAENETPFYVISHRTDPTWPFLYTRVCDPNTTIPDEPLWKWRGKMGLFVDIIAVDGLGDTFEKATRNLYNSIFKLSIANASNWTHFFKSRIRMKWYVDPVRFCFYVMGKFVKPQKLLNSIEAHHKKCPISSVKYSGEVGGAFAYGKKEIMESSMFTEFTEVEFEGKKFKAFKEYDKFLTHVYGDYMTPPPKEKQIGHHYIDAYKRGGVTHQKYNAYYTAQVDYNIAPLQAVELDILKVFKKICEKHNLRYFLAFGTCLGAARHSGFIPWDDDIDVIMPHEDYERLIQLGASEFPSNYFLQSYESEPECGLCDAKLRRSDTTLIAGSLAGKKVNHGINIDIYPYYHLADKKVHRYIQYFNSMLWMLLTVDEPPKKHSGLLSTGSRILLSIIPKASKPSVRDRAYRAMTKYEKVETKNVFFALGNIKVMLEKYNSSWFSDSIVLSFEDDTFPVPVGYKDYLNSRYGTDYMDLPPESERGVKLNDIVAWSADIPYKEYELKM